MVGLIMMQDFLLEWPANTVMNTYILFTLTFFHGNTIWWSFSFNHFLLIDSNFSNSTYDYYHVIMKFSTSSYSTFKGNCFRDTEPTWLIHEKFAETLCTY